MTESGERDRNGIKRAVEALVFLSPGGLTTRRIAEALSCPPGEVDQAAGDLALEYSRRGSGLELVSVAEGYQFVTAGDLSEVVDGFLTVVRKRQLSQAALETLAIVAYRQPITRPEIEIVRGVDSGGVLAGLLDKKLVRMAGRRKAPGRPVVYATTRDFLLHFGLRDLKDLPALSELGRLKLPEEDNQDETG